MSTRLGFLYIGAPVPNSCSQLRRPFPAPARPVEEPKGGAIKFQIPRRPVHCPAPTPSPSPGAGPQGLCLMDPGAGPDPGEQRQTRGGGRSTKSRFRVTCPMFSSVGQGHEEEEVEEEPGPTVLGRCRPGQRPPPPGSPLPPGSPASLACTISSPQASVSADRTSRSHAHSPL